MRYSLCAIMAALLFAPVPQAFGAEPPSAPLRIGIAGLVHGHVSGFLGSNRNRTDIQIVGIAEPDEKLAARYADRYRLDRRLLFTRLDDMLDKAHPQAVLAYTNTLDHRAVVEACAGAGFTS